MGFKHTPIREKPVHVYAKLEEKTVKEEEVAVPEGTDQPEAEEPQSDIPDANPETPVADIPEVTDAPEADEPVA